MKKDFGIIVMSELAKNKTLREAVKWLDTSISSVGKTPAQLIKNGNSQKALNLLRKGVK